MEKLDSEYKKLLPDDVKLFDDLLTRYARKRLEDLNELYEISTTALILSARWCEIQSTASVVAKLNNISKTDFDSGLTYAEIMNKNKEVLKEALY
jgi:hypothetical protein